MAALLLSSCFQPAPHGFEIASTAGPLELRFFIGDEARWEFQVEGVTFVDLEFIMSVSDRCTDTGPAKRMEITDAETDRVLLARDVVEHPICADDRLVWNGEDLLELEDDERWPDGLYLPYDTFEVASTAGPIMLTFPIGDRELAIAYNVSGRKQVSLLELGSSSACTDTSHYEPLAMRIRDRNRDGAVLHERDLLESPVCADDRYLWDGQGLIELEHGEPWPDGLYRTPDIHQGARPLPTYGSSDRG